MSYRRAAALGGKAPEPWLALVLSLFPGLGQVYNGQPAKAFVFFSGNLVNYPGSQYDNIGRFWYIELKKKF